MPRSLNIFTLINRLRCSEVGELRCWSSRVLWTCPELLLTLLTTDLGINHFQGTKFFNWQVKVAFIRPIWQHFEGHKSSLTLREVTAVNVKKTINCFFFFVKMSNFDAKSRRVLEFYQYTGALNTNLLTPQSSQDRSAMRLVSERQNVSKRVK